MIVLQDRQSCDGTGLVRRRSWAQTPQTLAENPRRLRKFFSTRTLAEGARAGQSSACRRLTPGKRYRAVNHELFPRGARYLPSAPRLFSICSSCEDPLTRLRNRTAMFGSRRWGRKPIGGSRIRFEARGRGEKERRGVLLSQIERLFFVFLERRDVKPLQPVASLTASLRQITICRCGETK